MNVIGNFIGNPPKSAGGVTQEYAAVLAEATRLGYGLPSLATQSTDNAAIRLAKADGTWTLSDFVYKFYTDASSDFTRINWKNPTGTKITVVGTCTFTANSGWKFTGGGHLDTGFIPSTHGVNYTQNSGSFCVWTDKFAKSAASHGCYDGSFCIVYPREVDNKSSSYLNTTDQGAQAYDNVTELCVHGQRINGTQKTFMNGLGPSIEPGVVSVGRPARSIRLGASDFNGTITNKDNTGTIRFAYLGSGSIDPLKGFNFLNKMFAPTQPVIVLGGTRNIKTDNLSLTYLQGRDGSELVQMGDWVYLIAGWNPDVAPVTNSQIWRANISDLTSWTQLADGPFYRRHTFGFGTANGKMYLWGSDPFSGSNAHDCWEGTVNNGTGAITWVQKSASLPYPDRILFAGFTHNDALYTIGGQTNLATPIGPFTDVWRSTDGGVNWTQMATGLTQFGKCLSGCGFSFNGKIYIISGSEYNNIIRYDRECYVSTNNGTTWSRTANDIPVGLFYNRVVTSGNRLFCMFGATQASENGDNIIHVMSTSEQFSSYRNNVIKRRHATAACEVTLSDGSKRILVGTGTGTGSGNNGVDLTGLHNDIFIIDPNLIP